MMQPGLIAQPGCFFSWNSANFNIYMKRVKKFRAKFINFV